jgi:hypothetical protein
MLDLLCIIHSIISTMLVESKVKIIKELQLLDSDISSLTIRDVGTSGPD